jgi:hypothetical protein
VLYKGTLQIVPKPLTPIKYITGTLSKGRKRARVERGREGREGKGRIGERVSEDRGKWEG